MCKTTTSTTVKKTGGDAILDVLTQYSVEYVFTSPIAALAPFWEAFAKRRSSNDASSPKYVNCRHETLAVSLAIGYHKSTGKLPAVCLPTGLGVLNGSMALRTARMEHIPMLIISPDTLTFGEDPSKDPGPEWATFLIDDVGPAKHAATTTKWQIACRTPLDLYPNLHRAMYFAQQLPRGPVMVEIPFDIMMTSYDDDSALQNRMPALTSDSVVASPALIQRVANTIASAVNPIIITEHFGSSAHAVSLLDSLAKTIAAPVFEWWMPSFNNFDRSSPLHGKGYVEEVLGDADVVIVLCSHGPWHGPNQKLRNGCQVIVIDEAPLRPTSAYWGYATTCCVSGDPTKNVESLLNCLRSSSELDQTIIADRYRGWKERNESKQKEIENGMSVEAAKEVDGKCVHASVVFEQLAQILPAGSIIVDEMVSQVPAFTHYFFQRPEKEFLHYRGWQGGLGTSIGVALGAKLAHPDRVVVCAIGDGAFNYNPIPSCLGFSQQYHVPIIIVVMNNSGYLSQNWNMYKYFPEGSSLADNYLPGAAIDPSPKYSMLPPVWGGHGERVESKEDLADALASAVEYAKQHFVLLDVSCTP